MKTDFFVPNHESETSVLDPWLLHGSGPDRRADHNQFQIMSWNLTKVTC